MKHTYEKPEITVTNFANEDIITTSALINGGANGKPDTATFGELFEK